MSIKTAPPVYCLCPDTELTSAPKESMPSFCQRVFKKNYIGVILTKNCPWDDLCSNRTRKNIPLEIQSRKKILIHSSCNFLCNFLKSLTLSFSADFSGSCTHTETLLAPGENNESNGFLSQEREITQVL